jgi:excisionase family DNA binding protein
MKRKAKNMRKPPEQLTPPGYLGVADAAAYMGISVRTLHSLVARREIEFIRVGHLKFTQAACDRFMRERTIAPGKRR